VVVIPSLKKAAFLIGGETGSGVMSCRHAHGWNAPVFMHIAKGSVGLQIGAEEIDLSGGVLRADTDTNARVYGGSSPRRTSSAAPVGL